MIEQWLVLYSYFTCKRPVWHPLPFLVAATDRQVKVTGRPIVSPFVSDRTRDILQECRSGRTRACLASTRHPSAYSTRSAF